MLEHWWHQSNHSICIDVKIFINTLSGLLLVLQHMNGIHVNVACKLENQKLNICTESIIKFVLVENIFVTLSTGYGHRLVYKNYINISCH